MRLLGFVWVTDDDGDPVNDASYKRLLTHLRIIKDLLVGSSLPGAPPVG